MPFLLLSLNFTLICKFQKLAFAELSDKTNHMSKINVGLTGTAQWYLENEGFYFG